MKSPTLLFQWPHRHRIHLLLPAALILAALAHGGIFFLFSVATPPVKADGLNPARVYFLGEGSPELAQLESVLTSNDPSLFAPRHASPAYRESTAAYTPQYASLKTALLNMPLRVQTDEAPSPMAGPVPFKKVEPPRGPATSPADSNRLSSSPELTARLPKAPEAILLPRGSTPDSLESVSFFVGISSDGTVMHILPNRSSGDTGLDLQTLQILKSLHFAPTDDSALVWGFVDFHFASGAPTRNMP